MIASYAFYGAGVLSATLLAWLSQIFFRYRNGNRRPHLFFYSLSALVLIFIMGFRAQTAVDDGNYLRIYNEVAEKNIIEFYQTRTTEPFYVLLNYFVKFVFDDFQWVIIITSAIMIACFYWAISYEFGKISLGLAVFIFATTQYFYYFGIIRLGIAVSIIVVAYRFIIENKKSKYIFMVLLATMFHYSALFALIMVVVKIDRLARLKQGTFAKIFLAIPIAFFLVRLLAAPFLSERYSKYFASDNFISFGFINLLPFLLLYMLDYKKLRSLGVNYEYYFVMFYITIITEAFAPIIGIGRMIWYFSLSNAFLLPGVIRVNKEITLKFLLVLLTIGYCVFYSYIAYFGVSDRSPYMLPYRNVFFELNY